MSETKRNVVAGHRIKWFVYAWEPGGEKQKLRHEAQMSTGWSAWDAECECGWQSRTGGSTKGCVRQMVREHKCEAGASVPSERMDP